MCRVQFVRACLSCGRLHHDGGNPDRIAGDVLEAEDRRGNRDLRAGRLAFVTAE